MQNKGIKSLITGGNQRGQFPCLTKIINRHGRLSVKQHTFRRPACHKLDALSVDACKNIGDGLTIFARLRHDRAKRILHVGDIAATFRKRLSVTNAPTQAL